MSNFLHRSVDPNSHLSLAYRARKKRWQHLIDTFPGFSEMRVLDLGGTPQSWELAPIIPSAVTIVNLQAHQSDNPSISSIVVDACNLPTAVPD